MSWPYRLKQNTQVMHSLSQPPAPAFKMSPWLYEIWIKDGFQMVWNSLPIFKKLKQLFNHPDVRRCGPTALSSSPQWQFAELSVTLPFAQNTYGPVPAHMFPAELRCLWVCDTDEGAPSHLWMYTYTFHRVSDSGSRYNRCIVLCETCCPRGK